MIRVSKLLWWRLGFGLLSLACVALIALLWMSGASETQDAFNSGRRLVIALDSGKIEGKFVTTQDIPKPTASVSAPAATPETKPAEPAVTQENHAAPAPGTTTPQASETSPNPPTASKVEESQEVLAVAEETPEETAAELNAPMIPSSSPPHELNPALAEKSEAGLLPVIGKDGTKPWRYYAKTFERKNSQPMIAIIITGLGYNKAVTNSAMRLSENITLAFSPYARDITSWETSGRVSGHEMLVDLPMEPNNYPAADPGPYGLIISKGLSENEKRLEWLMSRFPGYVGFLTPQNEVYSGNEEAFRVLLQSVANRGLMLVVGREPYKTEIKTMIDASNTPVVIADTLLDEELSVTAIQSRLAQLEEMAKKRGYAVAIGQAYPLTLEQLRIWSETLAEKGIILAPVSAVTRLRFS